MRRDLIALDDRSKVWVYQSNVHIEDEICDSIREQIYDFTMQWSSHGQELQCYGNLFHNRFLVLVADDTTHIGGCSIDSSVHFIKSLEHKFNLDFFDRLNFSYVVDDHFNFVHNSELKEAYTSGQLNDDTLMVNNLVKTKEEFLTQWIIPLNESWYKKLLA